MRSWYRARARHQRKCTTDRSARRDERRAARADRLLVRTGAGRRGCGACRGVGCGRGLGRWGQRPLSGGWCRFRRRPGHLLGALLGDDDVALLLGGGFVVDALQRVGPGLSDRLARAGRIELLAVAERIRRRRIRLAVDRHRRAHVLAGVAIGVEARFRRRAERLAGLFVIGEAGGNGGERDRKISAVTGADADGAEGAGLRTEIGAGRVRIAVVVAEQIFQEIARAARGIGILRAAIVLRQRQQDRAALIVALGAAEAAAQPLEAGRDLLEIGTHLLNLGVDWAALRRLAGEQREKSRAVAAHPLGLRRDAIELALLLGRGLLVAADLLLLGRVAAAAAAVDGRQLRFQSRAHRIDGGPLRGRRLRRTRIRLRPG